MDKKIQHSKHTSRTSKSRKKRISNWYYDWMLNHLPQRWLVDLQILFKESKLGGLVLLWCLHRPEKVAVGLQNPQNLHFQDCYQPSHQSQPSCHNYTLYSSSNITTPANQTANNDDLSDVVGGDRLSGEATGSDDNVVALLICFSSLYYSEIIFIIRK